MSVIENGLWKAANVLRDGGFAQGNLQTQAGEHCALGAYVAAYDEDFGNSTADAADWIRINKNDEVKVLADTIRELFPQHARTADTDTVIRFNDATGTTQEDVVKVFRVAAVKAAAGI